MNPFYEYKTTLPHYVFKRDLGFPLHLHMNIEMLYLLRGEIELTLGNRRYPVHAGDFALVFPNQIHACRMISPRSETAGQILSCETPVAGRFENVLLTSQPVHPIVTAENLHKDVPYAFDSIRETKGQESPDAVTTLFMQLILARTLPYMELVSKPNELPQDLTARIIEYVTGHFREPLSLEILSKKFGVSRYHLSRIFSDTIKVGFYRYINSMRITAARELLQNTNQDILGIGLDCGFENQQTFNRVFKEQTGMTPKEYRKTYAYPAVTGMESTVEYLHKPVLRGTGS